MNKIKRTNSLLIYMHVKSEIFDTISERVRFLCHNEGDLSGLHIAIHKSFPSNLLEAPN